MRMSQEVEKVAFACLPDAQAAADRLRAWESRNSAEFRGNDTDLLLTSRMPLPRGAACLDSRASWSGRSLGMEPSGSGIKTVESLTGREVSKGKLGKEGAPGTKDNIMLPEVPKIAMWISPWPVDSASHGPGTTPLSNWVADYGLTTRFSEAIHGDNLGR